MTRVVDGTNDAMEMDTTEADRSVVLTGLLVVMAIAQVAGVVVGVIAWRSLVAHDLPHPALPLLGAALSVTALVAVAGMWQWRRWAVFLFAALAVIGLASDLRFGVQPIPTLIRLALYVALGFCIKQSWARFR